MKRIEDILQVFEQSIDITKPYLCTNLEENSEIEFKNSLQTRSDSLDKQYLKTIAGFANNSGGTIIFGVSPELKEIVGIKNEYENLDNRYISTTISHGLDGSFHFSFVTKRFLDKIVGFLLVNRAIDKPVIMKVDASDLKLGEIYYRYPAQTTRILSSDLRRIIDETVSFKLEQTINNITKLVAAGNDAAILNTQSGVIDSGKSVPKFILDESIIKNINLIKLGHFVEEDGAPAYVIKGEIETNGMEYIEKKVLSNLHPQEIIQYFTSQECESPKLVLEKLLTLSSPYFPVHFFIKKLNFTEEDTMTYIMSFDEKLINIKTRAKIIERLNGNYNYGKQGVIMSGVNETNSGTGITNDVIDVIRLKLGKTNTYKSQIKRTIIYNSLIKGEELNDELIENEAELLFEAFSNVKKEVLLTNRNYFLDLINKLDKAEVKTKVTPFRKLICFVDETFYL